MDGFGYSPWDWNICQHFAIDLWFVVGKFSSPREHLGMFSCLKRLKLRILVFDRQPQDLWKIVFWSGKIISSDFQHVQPPPYPTIQACWSKRTLYFKLAWTTIVPYRIWSTWFFSQWNFHRNQMIKHSNISLIWVNCNKLSPNGYILFLSK